jgi:hypothetical protein
VAALTRTKAFVPRRKAQWQYKTQAWSDIIVAPLLPAVAKPEHSKNLKGSEAICYTHCDQMAANSKDA